MRGGKRRQSVTGRSGRAGAADAEDLDRVVDLGVAELLGHIGGPALNGAALDLLGPAAGAAHQVMVVRLAGVATEAVGALALGTVNDVDDSVVGERLQVPVDGRQAYRVALGAQRRIDVLRAAETARLD